MKKAELIDAVQARAGGMTKAQINGVVDAITDVAYECARQGEDFAIPGLLKIAIKYTPPRVGRNPATGEEIDIQAKRVPKITAAKPLKDVAAV